MSLGGLKWTLVVTLLMYLVVLVMKNNRFIHPKSIPAADENCCEDRQVDISDSRLSIFGSNSGPQLDTSEELTADRVIPLTKTLNRAMEKVCRKSALWIQLENKKILFLNDILNLTFTEIRPKGKTEEDVFGMNGVVSKLDTLHRIGNAFIAENSDSTIVLIQKFRFQIMKYKYDYFDKDLNPLGSSSFVYDKNLFLLRITLSTNYDNSECKISSVNLTFEPDTESSYLKIEGLFGTEDFRIKLKTVLYKTFVEKVTLEVIKEILPIITKVIHQADLCLYFDAKTNKNVDTNDFSAFRKFHYHYE